MPRKISPLARRALGLAPSVGHTSSRVTKGKRMFIELGDGRTQWARRWADLIVAHVNDFAGSKGSPKRNSQFAAVRPHSANRTRCRGGVFCAAPLQGFLKEALLNM
jgi:hypothetical protein